ncbi:hypothetical protein HMPREF1984_00514, partial [Leptotrichia sp. oral taxon 215 str. W9775]
TNSFLSEGKSFCLKYTIFNSEIREEDRNTVNITLTVFLYF